MHKSFQKYFCFQWRNQSFAFQGLLFGLNTAPMVFSKLVKPAEERVSNTRIPGRLLYPRFLHRRVKSRHFAATGPSTVAGSHHQLEEIHPRPHSVIDIPWPLHKLTDNVTQPPREKQILNIQHKYQKIPHQLAKWQA